jgi:hypothetical protein
MAAWWRWNSKDGRGMVDNSWFPGTWRITGSRNETLRRTFERLARRAGAKIALGPGGDDLQIWLDTIRHQSPSFGWGRSWIDEAGALHVSGRIENASLASANICTELELAFATLAGWKRQPYFTNVANGPISAMLRAQTHRYPEYYQWAAVSGMTDQPPETLAVTDVRGFRAALLSNYKAATGISKDAPIYSARQHSMHKPQFYQWRSGILSPASAVSLSFERFLREQRPPILRLRRQ